LELSKRENGKRASALRLSSLRLLLYHRRKVREGLSVSVVIQARRSSNHATLEICLTHASRTLFSPLEREEAGYLLNSMYFFKCGTHLIFAESKNLRLCIPTLHCGYDQIPVLVHFFYPQKNIMIYCSQCC